SSKFVLCIIPYQGFFNSLIETDRSSDRIQASPNSHSSVTLNISQSEFNACLSYANQMVAETLQGNGDYDVFGGNCVDFMGEIVDKVGEGGRPLTDFLTQKGVPTYIYADVNDFFTVNDANELYDVDTYM